MIYECRDCGFPLREGNSLWNRAEAPPWIRRLFKRFFILTVAICGVWVVAPIALDDPDRQTVATQIVMWVGVCFLWVWVMFGFAICLFWRLPVLGARRVPTCSACGSSNWSKPLEWEVWRFFGLGWVMFDSRDRPAAGQQTDAEGVDEDLDEAIKDDCRFLFNKVRHLLRMRRDTDWLGEAVYTPAKYEWSQEFEHRGLRIEFLLLLSASMNRPMGEDVRYLCGLGASGFASDKSKRPELQEIKPRVVTLFTWMREALERDASLSDVHVQHFLDPDEVQGDPPGAWWVVDGEETGATPEP